jgi:hypothetical protein
VQITVNAMTHAPAPTVPAWLIGQPARQWIQIPNTGMNSLDLTQITALGLNPGDWSFGEPHKGRFAYSGGCVRLGSRILLFGGGGAGAWAGNEWWELNLLDDVPVWHLLVPPSPASAVYPRNTQPAHAYMKDGTPNARHSYWAPQCIDANAELMVFGCVDVWEVDSGRFLNVDGYDLTAGGWRPTGSHPDMPHQRAYDGNWTVKHPTTEDVYVCAGSFLSRWNRTSNTWTDIANALDTGMDAGFAAVDPNTGSILRIGRAIGSNVAQRIDYTTGAVVPGTLVGPYASAVNLADYAHFNGSGFVYDLGLQAYLLFQNAGQIFKITPSGNDWNVDLFVTTGVAPPTRTDMAPGSGLWGRFAYLPALRGVCLVTPGADSPWSQNAFFLQTS